MNIYFDVIKIGFGIIYLIYTIWCIKNLGKGNAIIALPNSKSIYLKKSFLIWFFGTIISFFFIFIHSVFFGELNKNILSFFCVFLVFSIIFFYRIYVFFYRIDFNENKISFFSFAKRHNEIPWSDILRVDFKSNLVIEIFVRNIPKKITIICIHSGVFDFLKILKEKIPNLENLLLSENKFPEAHSSKRYLIFWSFAWIIFFLSIFSWYGGNIEVVNNNALLSIVGKIQSIKYDNEKIHIYVKNDNKIYHLIQKNSIVNVSKLMELKNDEYIHALINPDVLGRDLNWLWQLDRNDEILLSYKQTLKLSEKTSLQLRLYAKILIFLSFSFFMIGFIDKKTK